MPKRKRSYSSSFLRGAKTGYKLWQAAKQMKKYSFRRKSGYKNASQVASIQRSYRSKARATKISAIRRRLMKLGVQANSQPKFHIDQIPRKMTGSQGLKTFNWVDFDGSKPGINSKPMLEVVSAELGITDSDAKVCIAQQTNSLMLSNSSNAPCYITVYWMKFKENWTSTMGSSLTVNLLNDGFLRVGLTNASEQNLNVSIFQNKKLMHWCQPIKTQRTYLAAGGVRKFTYTDRNIRTFNLQYKSEADLLVLKGTITPLVVFHGVPVHQNDNNTLISTSIADLDVITSYSTKYYDVTQDTFQVSEFDNLISITGPSRYTDTDIQETAVTS